MEYRTLGRTGWKVSAISFGAWAIGGTWGAVKDEESLAALHRAVEMGVREAAESGVLAGYPVTDGWFLLTDEILLRLE